MPMKIKIPYAKLPVVTKTKFCLAVVGMALGFASMARAENPPGDEPSNPPEFKNLSDLKWDKILPDLGKNSQRFAFCMSIQKRKPPVCLYARQRRSTYASIGIAPTKLTRS